MHRQRSFIYRFILGFGWFLILSVFFPNLSFSSHEITSFQNNKKGAVSLTFDDGYLSQVTNGFPLLNTRNLKGTVFVVTGPGWINSHVSWETWRQIASEGHEIGNSTMDHPNLTALSEGDVKWELQESQGLINKNIPTLSSSPEEVIFAVNCGGPAYVDQRGILYQADRFFLGGRKKTTKVTIGGVEDDLLYRSERCGNFSYDIPVSNGIYTVTLKFAETYYHAPGKRLFDVKIQGQEVLTHLDLFAQAGRNKAYDVLIPASVTDGVLSIDFLAERRQAKVNAIVVAPSRPCLSLAYPFGASNPQVRLAASETHIAARGTWTPEGGFLNHYENGPGWMAVDFLNVGSYEIDGNTTLADLDHYLNLAEQRKAWFCPHLHEVTNPNFLSQFLDHLLTRNVWLDTFGTIARYMQERLSSNLTVLSEDSSEIRLHLFH
ncbi:MAG: malectin domain-containing carbohydrate-binding protein [Thermodesulfobacteriota bacterium]|jgi:hypothetical protein